MCTHCEYQLPTHPPVIPQNAEQPCINETVTLPTPNVITGGVSDLEPIPPESTGAQNVIPGNTDVNADTLDGQQIGACTDSESQPTKPPESTLTKIDIFMTQCCTILLICHDIESALKAADIPRKESTSATETIVTPTQPEDVDKTSNLVYLKPEVRTSLRTMPMSHHLPHTKSLRLI